MRHWELGATELWGSYPIVLIQFHSGELRPDSMLQVWCARRQRESEEHENEVSNCWFIRKNTKHVTWSEMHGLV